MIITILILVIIAVVAIFSVQNATPVAISFFYWRFEASLAIVVFLSLICGVVMGALIVSLLHLKKKHKPNF